MIMTIRWGLYIIIFLFGVSYVNAQIINYDRPITDIVFNGIKHKSVQEKIDKIVLDSSANTLANTKKLNKDIQTIYKLGYFEKVSVSSNSEGGRHELVFELVENLPIKTLVINLENKEIKTIITERFEPVINQPLNALILEEIKELTINKIKQLGYDFFEFNQIVFDKPSQTLYIDTSQAYIESIEFIGLSKIKSQLLLREMKQQIGEVFNSLDLRKDREKLIRLGYFTTISAPQFTSGTAPNNLKIVFNVIEKKLNKVSLGIEQDQQRYYGFISNRHHHLIIPSDLITLKTQIQFEESIFKLNRYSLSYSQPWLFNKINMSGSLRYYNLEKQERLNNQVTQSLRQGQSVRISVPITDYIALSSALKFETISQINESDAIDPYSIRSLEFNISYESVNNLMDPKRGLRMNLSMEQANDLGFIEVGGISFTQLSSSLSHYYTIFKNITLASRLKGGIFYPTKETVNTYENEYFLMGGSRSIRGYNEATSIFSGRRFLLTNLELRYSLSKTIQTIGFIDYGNAFDAKINLEEFHIGYGIGFRYHTPIGAIRIDCAQGESDLYIHLGLGHVF
jgi:outer membrane protein insertion porin family